MCDNCTYGCEHPYAFVPDFVRYEERTEVNEHVLGPGVLRLESSNYTVSGEVSALSIRVETSIHSPVSDGGLYRPAALGGEYIESSNTMLKNVHFYSDELRLLFEATPDRFDTIVYESDDVSVTFTNAFVSNIAWPPGAAESVSFDAAVDAKYLVRINNV